MQGRDDVSAEDGIGAGGVDSADAGGVDGGSMGAVDDHDRSGLGQHRLRPGLARTNWRWSAQVRHFDAIPWG